MPINDNSRHIDNSHSLQYFYSDKSALAAEATESIDITRQERGLGMF